MARIYPRVINLDSIKASKISVGLKYVVGLVTRFLRFAELWFETAHAVIRRRSGDFLRFSGGFSDRLHLHISVAQPHFASRGV
jgi:hypothetical protein